VGLGHVRELICLWFTLESEQATISVYCAFSSKVSTRHFPLLNPTLSPFPSHPFPSLPLITRQPRQIHRSHDRSRSLLPLHLPLHLARLPRRRRNPQSGRRDQLGDGRLVGAVLLAGWGGECVGLVEDLGGKSEFQCEYKVRREADASSQNENETSIDLDLSSSFSLSSFSPIDRPPPPWVSSSCPSSSSKKAVSPNSSKPSSS